MAILFGAHQIVIILQHISCINLHCTSLMIFWSFMMTLRGRVRYSLIVLLNFSQVTRDAKCGLESFRICKWRIILHIGLSFGRTRC